MFLSMIKCVIWFFVLCAVSTFYFREPTVFWPLILIADAILAFIMGFDFSLITFDRR
jgi:hypothetical protein